MNLLQEHNEICFYHAIERKTCGYIKRSEKFICKTPAEYLPELKKLLKDMLFELSEHVRFKQKCLKSLDRRNTHFRIEVFFKDDSPQIAGHTVWMVLETSLDQDDIHIFIETLAIFGDYYNKIGE